MPYDSSGVFTRASNTTPTAGTAITVTMHETEWEDLKTSMNKLPVKDVANTMTANQQITVAEDGALYTSLTYTLYRNSASPAAADGLGGFVVDGNDAAGNQTRYGGIVVLIADTTDTSEDGVLTLRTMRAGTFTTRFNIGDGFYRQGGTDLGAGTGNVAHIGITDGVTAPSTVSGVAQIYVDSADGDLKIKYGDGTVKTIVVDT